MQTIVAGLMAITAMGASILANVDPIGTVVRGAGAYVVGLLLAGIWTMVVNPQEEKKKKEKPKPEEPTESDQVESEESDEKEEQEEAA